MKTILVPVGGGDTDPAVFETALCAARPLGAHLEFFHLRISPSEAALNVPHVEFTRGPAIADAISKLQEEAASRAAAAAHNFHALCERENIEIVDSPRSVGAVTASWREEIDDALNRLLLRARHNDLVVAARAARPNGLPPDTLERLLVGSGRPMLIAPRKPPQRLTGTAMVCWKETPESARAVAAALPLLAKADRVVFVAIEEDGQPPPAALHDMARQMAWHGIDAEAEFVAADGRTAAEQLASSAAALRADLMVMGGFGHGRTQELIFGGCTRAVLDHAELPVFLLH